MKACKPLEAENDEDTARHHGTSRGFSSGQATVPKVATSSKCFNKNDRLFSH